MTETVRAYFDADMAGGEVVPAPEGTVVVATARSPVKEAANEDSAAIIPAGPDSIVLAIADGLGGGPSGELASNVALRSLIRSVENALREDAPLRTAVLDGCESANRAILDSGRGAATTLAVAEIQGRAVRPYHVGDSTILIVGQRAKLKLLTTSHSPVGFAVEAGVLNEQEAMFHDDRHLVSNVVGCPNMKIELGPLIRLAPRDTLLLASDGLFDNLHLEEIVERIRKGPLEKAAERLLTDARQRMLNREAGQPSKPDDLTLVLYRPVPGRPAPDAPA